MKRSSRQDVFCKKGVLKNFAKLTGKAVHLLETSFFNKVPGWGLEIYKSTYGRLLLTEANEMRVYEKGEI